MKLSVIIVNFNHKYFPRLAVEALEKSKTNFPFEIIVVDNHSSDEESLMFLKKAHEDKRITLICSPENVGFGRGNNLGAAIARGEYLFFHNPDVTVKEDSLQKMVDFLARNKDIGMIGPKLVYSSGKVQESCRRHMKFGDLVLNRTFLGKLPMFQERVKHYLMEDFDHSKIQDVDLVTGAAIMMPREVFEKIGGFDKRYFLFMEDFDLCRMTKKAGYRVVYYPDAEVNHYHKRLSQGSMFKLLRKKVFWLHVSSALKYFWKWRIGGGAHKKA
jgi:N-acetylglucosaminyl-diphospho-decaprenol L-rhamnosyltransferase